MAVNFIIGVLILMVALGLYGLIRAGSLADEEMERLMEEQEKEGQDDD